MKVPLSAGRWSAFWMMPEPQPGRSGCQPWTPGQGECAAFGGWPRSGEIDVMEHVNKDTEVLGTLHWGTADGKQASEGGSRGLSDEELQGWNVYQLQWSCDAIRWYVNGQEMHKVLRPWVQPQWPFDEPFFLILNTAVGGALTGYSDADAATAEMLVDYVRVYAS
ncbi:concanavalin A-like lectin/glucanase domain-containing protein [Scenedesmus sp. NREL 46B-D3]|nr:concanavalin A-like lectin/glucanase domain-containing protein [Scenedesmus sp. NREL 46B-D3]